MSEASEATQFKVGNHAWKARSSHGRKPLFTDPDVLLAACVEYLEWVDDNPLYAVELVKFQGEAKQVQVPKMRAMTIVGLCNFLDINRSTWQEYRKKAEFSAIVEHVEDCIRQQKIEGAAADMLNSSFIAREMGLADKTEVKATGADIKHIESEYVNP